MVFPPTSLRSRGRGGHRSGCRAILGGVPQIDLIDDSFVVAPPAVVAAAVHDPAFWAELWPGLALDVVEDRGEQGIRWRCGGALTGSAEVWLESHGDGVIVHCYLRGDPPAGRSARRIGRETRRRQRQVKQVVFALKDRLEGDRPPGVSRLSGGGELPRPYP